MKENQLKLYQKYKYEDFITEYIYIGKYYDDYIFLFKKENWSLPKEFIINRNFDFNQTVKTLNLELDENGDIKGYDWSFCFRNRLRNRSFNAILCLSRLVKP